MTYIEGHKKSGLKVGNIVNVTRKAKNHEQWYNIWLSEMDKYVNKSGIIAKDHEDKGFLIKFNDESLYVFPYFVLSSRKDKIKKILE